MDDRRVGRAVTVGRGSSEPIPGDEDDDDEDDDEAAEAEVYETMVFDTCV